jgi:hypothetical protein
VGTIWGCTGSMVKWCVILCTWPISLPILALKWLLRPGKRRMPYSKYLSSLHWRKTRQQTKRKHGFKCQKCGSFDRLTVHHKTYKHLGNERSWELQLLCGRCHKGAHGGRAW